MTVDARWAMAGELWDPTPPLAVSDAAPLHEVDNPADRAPALATDDRPDPKVTYLVDGLPFGEYDPDGCWWIVQETKGWHSAPGMKTARTSRAFQAGDWRPASFRKARIVTLKGTCLAPHIGARQAALDRLASLCADGQKLHELRVTDQLGRVRTADVELEGEPDVTVRHETRFDFQIQLAAPDPRKHGIWQDPISETIQQGNAGLDFEANGGLDFSGSGLSFGNPPVTGIAQVGNYGTAAAYPFFRIRGPISVPVIADLNGGFTVVYLGNVADGEILAINCDDFAARGYRGHACWSSTRGNVRSLVAIPRDWPVVGPGETASYQLRTTTSGGSSELMTSLRSAWN